MSLFELFFPQTATAFHLRALRDQALNAPPVDNSDTLRETMTTEALRMRIDELEKDLGFVVLVLASVLSALDEKGTISRSDIERELRELDSIDGQLDERLSTRVLKTYLGKNAR